MISKLKDECNMILFNRYFEVISKVSKSKFKRKVIDFFSRAITATVDKSTNNRLHDLVLNKFGMTPYVMTYPDFLAGALVMSFALLIAAGLDRSKTLQRWINCLVCSALVVVLLIGAWDANIVTYKKQAFLFRGSNGVI